MSSQVIPGVDGHWIVRGIMPVISRLRLSRTDEGHVGSMDMWGTTVAVRTEETLRGVVITPDPSSGFGFVISGELEHNVLRLAFTNVGVDFRLTADRSSAEETRKHQDREPRPLPVPPLRDLPPDELVRRPPMGWNSWYGLRLTVDDLSVRRAADDLVRTGLSDAGYTYVTIDDGWQATRDSQGAMVPNRRFPDMVALGEHLHARGLKFGIYSSPGPATCADYAGSFGHEAQDARTYASWGVDFLKYDWCSAAALYPSETGMRGAYQRMGEALREAGRPIVFSLCQYGLFDVARWGRQAGGHLWRTGYDVEDTWASIAAIGFGDHADRGDGWNDLDMLQIGLGGLTLVEYRTQMSMWALLSAPLILSCDVGALTAEELEVLFNRDVIAIDQDPGGAAPVRRRLGAAEVWTKRLRDGVAVGILNPGDDPVEVEFTWSEIHVEDGGIIRDLWDRRVLSPSPTWSGTVDPHGCVLLHVAPPPE